MSENILFPMHQLSPARPTDKIPLYVLTGFLGSGKTTLLNGLLQQEQMPKTAIIVNEYGQIPIDHLLVENRDESMTVIAGGCLCCTVRHDLLEALDTLYQRRDDFEQIIIETSGMADPAPILRTLQTHPNYELRQMITTVDANNGVEQLAEQDESVQQAALAGQLIVTKTAQVSEAKLEALQASLKQLNPGAEFHYSPSATQIPSAKTLLKPLNDQHELSILPTLNDSASAKHRYIQSFCLEHEQPLSWQVLERWIQQMTRLRGRDLLRVKGIAYTEETDLPVLIQGVQHIFQKPVTLAAWPQTQPRTQIVFITRNLPLNLLKQSLEVLTQSKTPADVCAAALLFLQGMDAEAKAL